VALLARRKFSELPVVDDDGRPVGLVDVTDVVGWKGEENPSTGATSPQSPTADAGSPTGSATIRVYPEQGAA
jgi:hypothetical protein